MFVLRDALSRLRDALTSGVSRLLDALSSQELCDALRNAAEIDIDNELLLLLEGDASQLRKKHPKSMHQKSSLWSTTTAISYY